MHDSNGDGEAHHLPPAGMRDPIVRRKLARYLNPKREKDGFHLWDRTIRGRLPKLADYAVARALASYSSANGMNCRPGLDRLATDLCTSTKSVQRSLDYLCEHGWITLMNPGVRKRGEANDYGLSIPSWLAVELQVWGEDGALWMERPANMPRYTTGHRRPPKEPLGGHPEKLGGHLRLVKVDTDVQPSPQCTTPDEHHSESLTRPHADARGGEMKIDPDNFDADEQIAAVVAEKIGWEPSVFTVNLIASMLAEGRPIPAIINTAVARENDGANNPF